ncbi:metalloendopeptidase OMA1, mitochondrial-like isoform X2 [Portunus trituberculatus]|nr:metalloendopeptidase OMA1, mitochondrial-like isoform X2 [Portunus trituberculatus]
MLLLRVAQQAIFAHGISHGSRVLVGELSTAGRLSCRDHRYHHHISLVWDRTFSPVQFVRKIHTTRPRLVHPVLLAVLRPVSKFLAVLVGRGFRKWWQALPRHKKEVFRNHLRRNIVRYAVGCGLMGTAGFVYYNNHVTTAPYTGRRRFMAFNSQQQLSISNQLYQVVMEEYADHMLCKDHPMVDCVRRVGNRLLQANNTMPEMYTRVWTVSVVDNSLMNCFVLPTGDIVMFTGMMEVLDNDDQVAAVLAHEMSHTILEHVAEHLSQNYLLDLVILFPVALIWAVLPNDLLAALSHWLLNRVVELFLRLPYSRTLESEADHLGLRLAAKACYDVREFSAFWGKMAVLEKVKKMNGQETEVPFWLSTHPSNEDRQKEMDKQMPEAIDLRQFCKCPSLSLRDPREPIKRLQQSVTEQHNQTSLKGTPLKEGSTASSSS